jgi:hypothetical protein
VLDCVYAPKNNQNRFEPVVGLDRIGVSSASACAGHGGGHLTWTCRTCDQTVDRLPVGPHCSVVDGPAAVRISTSPSPEQPFEPPPPRVLYPASGEFDQTAATAGGQRP